MAEEVEAWDEFGRWEALEDGLRDVLEEHGVGHHEHDHDGEVGLRQLLEWAHEDPELLGEARRRAGLIYHLELHLVELQRFLLEHIEGTQLVLEEEPMAEMHELVARLIELELGAGAQELEHLREELHRERRALEVRAEHRELIVTMKYAELLGYDELFEW